MLLSTVGRIKSTYAEYPTQFWILMGASFVDSLGSALLFPFFALYVTRTFGIGLSQVGLIFASLMVSSMVVIVSATTSQSPWVHVRIRTGADDGFRKINLHLPLPLRLSAWGLRIFGGNMPGLDATGVDELIMSLEGDITRETPIHIEVHDGEDGEHVDVFMG
jgi:hypothetical protein